MSSQRMFALSVLAVAFNGVSCGSKPTTPTTPTPTPPPPVAVTLTAPRHVIPVDDAQTNTLQPELAVVNATSSQGGAKAYEFVVSSTVDFTAIAIVAENVPEDSDGETAWTVSRPLQGTTRYWWRAGVKQGTNIGHGRHRRASGPVSRDSIGQASCSIR